MRRDLGLFLVSVVFFIAASFCYLYTQRYTGDLPVISHPYRDYALPLAVIGAVPLILGLYLWLRGEPKRASSQSFSPTSSNLAFFIVAGLLMKVAAEVMHEVGGHGLYVLLFGGRILGVHISLLWPFQTSYIRWSHPSLGPLERGLIVGGGILNCLIVSFALQLFLLLRPQPWRLAFPLLWFSYWNYISSTGYLISWGYGPYGDVLELINMGILTRFSSPPRPNPLYSWLFLTLYYPTSTSSAFRLRKQAWNSCGGLLA